MKKLFLSYLILITFIASTAAASTPVSFQQLYGKGLSRIKPIKLSDITGKKLVLLWRADCVPCMAEMNIISKYSLSNPNLPIVIISLNGAKDARAKLPTEFSRNTSVLVSQNKTEEIFKTFGNVNNSLPFSVFLRKDGSICQKHYGIIGTNLINKWKEQC